MTTQTCYPYMGVFPFVTGYGRHGRRSVWAQDKARFCTAASQALQYPGLQPGAFWSRRCRYVTSLVVPLLMTGGGASEDLLLSDTYGVQITFLWTKASAE